MSQQNIDVFARVRPFSNDQQTCLVWDLSNSTITAKNKDYNFKKVFHQDASQESVFNDVGQPIVDGFVNGINGTIFAYGQTGSGKTHTMIGPDNNPEGHGIIPRTFTRIFDLLKAEKKSGTFKFTLKCSFVQLHNEILYDLLNNNCAEIEIYLSTVPVTVKGAAEIEVTTPEEFMEQLLKGLAQRKTAETLMNRESSRSHAIFMVTLETETSVNGITKTRSSRLNLVDLAGSENAKQTGNTGAQLREAGNINKSLSTLARVTRQLHTTPNQPISYRDSKLTGLLQDSLGGNSKTTFVINVSPLFSNITSTTSTLEFANNVKQIKNTTKINEQLSCKEVDSLKVVNGDLQRENEILQTKATDLTKKLTNQKKLTNLIEAKLLECQEEASKTLLQKDNEIKQMQIDNNAKIQKQDDIIKQLQTDNNAQTFKIQEKDEEIKQLRTLMAKLQLDNAIMNATIDLLDKTLLR